MPKRTTVRESLALGFALLFPLFMAWVYFVVIARNDSKANPLVMACYGGGKFLQFAFPALYVLVFARSELRPAKVVVAGVGLGVGFAAAVWLLLFAVYYGVLAGDPRLMKAADLIHGKLREFGLDSPAGFVLMATFLSVLHSLFEEYYWRWFVFGRLRRLMPVSVAMVVSSLGFMAHHVVILSTYFPDRFWAMTMPLSLCVAMGGLAWAWIYQRSGSLLGPWLSHTLIDAAIMIVGFDLLRAGWV